MNSLKSIWKNKFTSKGRCNRKEYWLFILISNIVVLILPIIGLLLTLLVFWIFAENSNKLSTDIFLDFFILLLSEGWFILYIAIAYLVIVLIFTFIMSIFIGIRRLHDINLSGWYLIPIIIISYLLDYLLDYVFKNNFSENIIMIFNLISSFIYIFILGLIPGKKEKNKYDIELNNSSQNKIYYY